MRCQRPSPRAPVRFHGIEQSVRMVEYVPGSEAFGAECSLGNRRASVSFHEDDLTVLNVDCRVTSLVADVALGFVTVVSRRASCLMECTSSLLRLALCFGFSFFSSRSPMSCLAKNCDLHSGQYPKEASRPIRPFSLARTRILSCVSSEMKGLATRLARDLSIGGCYAHALVYGSVSTSSQSYHNNSCFGQT